ncbi:MAG: hypothetical protein ACF8R7_02155 [Phycisphaerales bacterium JB039]
MKRTLALFATAALIAGCSGNGQKSTGSAAASGEFSATIINQTTDQVVYASMWQGGGEDAERIAMVTVEPGQTETLSATGVGPINLRVDPTPDAAKPTDRLLRMPGRVTMTVSASGEAIAVVPEG